MKLTSSLEVNLVGGSGKVALSGPLTFTSDAAPLVYAGREYRGKLRVLVVGNKLRLVNYVGLESYLLSLIHI